MVAAQADIAVVKGEYAAMARPDAVLDGDLRTLHVRCGSDIQSTLLAAGFRGDFLEHNYPYCYGPVSEGGDALSNARVIWLIPILTTRLTLRTRGCCHPTRAASSA